MQHISFYSFLWLLHHARKNRCILIWAKIGWMKMPLTHPPAIVLRSSYPIQETVPVVITAGEGFATEYIYATSSRPVNIGQTIVLKIDNTLVTEYGQETGIEYETVPETFYQFDNNVLKIEEGNTVSSETFLRISSTNKFGSKMKPGRYLLPVTAQASSQKMQSKTLFYDILVREPFEADAELYTGEDAFFVFYINTGIYDPRLVTDYYLSDDIMNPTWYNTIGNIVNLRKAVVVSDVNNGRAILDLGSDIRYILEHSSKYLMPLWETSRKVCLTIEGGAGLGFCNMTDEQITDFVAQVKLVMDAYPFDGINLWDRNSGYDKAGQNGHPDVNTTSYPKLIRALREMLGTGKLLTITDYEEPTEYFWNKEATGGIEVGAYIDYAWSGYNEYNESFQVIDPWHQEDPSVSSLHRRKPIAGLSPQKYGCLNVPWFRATKDTEYEELQGECIQKLSDWVSKGYKPNNIVVYEDLISHHQDNTEGIWHSAFSISLQCLNPGGKLYPFDSGRLSKRPDTAYNYDKWLKDW